MAWPRACSWPGAGARRRSPAASLDNKQFQNYFNDGPLLAFFRAPDTVWTPRVLKDGSDSVGALGALNRVYLNIGLFSEEWTAALQRPGRRQAHLADQDRGRAEELGVLAGDRAADAGTSLYFLNPKVTGPHKLQDAPGGEQHLSKDKAVLTRGKVVFAEYCARCHSSKGPEPAPGVDPGGQAGKDYLVAFKRYWLWTKTPEFKEKMRQIVLADDFLDDNYLSTELRIPTTLLKTNACSSLATNALRGDIWDNFSSQTYKELPAVGKIKVHNPITGEARVYEMPAGGRGYTRPASLISVWSTAPFLLNNQIGKFDPSPSVEARLGSFNDSIEKLLWPEKRDKDKVLGDKVPGLIDRTTETSYLRVPAGYLPDTLQDLRGPLQRYLPWLFADSGIEIGPIPAGTPVNLLSNRSSRVGQHRRSREAGAQEEARRLSAQSQGRSQGAAREPQRRGWQAGVHRPRGAAARAQPLPGLRRQSRPLLRHQRVQGRSRCRRPGILRGRAAPERRGQARPDRVREDVLRSGVRVRGEPKAGGHQRMGFGRGRRFPSAPPPHGERSVQV